MANVTMYDAVTVTNIPQAEDVIVAGYATGIYANISQMMVRFPVAPILTIDVTGTGKAQCLDVESGDATVSQIDPWLSNYALTGPVFSRPVVYMSLDYAKASFPTAPPEGCWLWTAHYTGVEHYCGPACGLAYTADATQYSSTATLDTSVVNSASLTATTLAKVGIKVASTPPMVQKGTVHSDTTGGTATVFSVDGGHTWLYANDFPEGKIPSGA